MITPKIQKTKKYLFLISITFLIASFCHLTYLYLYENAVTIPVKGGTVSEGLIGSFPSLNPLKNLSGNNQYVINLIYRSLLRYDLNQQKIVGDIANCDISKITNIECYINEDAKWSNGEYITAEDVYQTYNTIKNYNTNIILSSLLEGTTIEYKDNVISFKNNKQDVNFLNVFFQPILSKTVIDNLTEENIFGNFPTAGGLYSGNFKISSVSSDTTIGVSKLFLEKNDYFSKSNLSKITLNIFPDVNTFLKNKQSVSIFNDNENIVGNSIPRLGSYKYTLPQFVGLFINQNNIQNLDLRNFIFNKINTNNLIELLGKDNFISINNPYLGETEINKEPYTKNFESIMNSLGYVKKSALIANLNTNSPQSTNSENQIIIDDEDDLNIDSFQEKTKYITKPSYVEKYNFITKDDILLEGNVDDGTQEVYINDYKLTGFSSGDKVFFYRLRESYDSIKEGLNSYKVYFVKDGEKELKEEVFFLYYKNQNTLNEEKNLFIQKLYNEYKESNAEVISNREVQEINVNEQELQRLSKLDENYYYNKDLVPFVLRLYYSNTDKNIDLTANFIMNSLKELGIEIELIPFELNDVAKILANKDDYDMILTGVNLGYFDFNIFPYFHSSQASAGYNFSNIKRTSLDLLLEELKSNILNEERVKDLEGKVLDILKEEQIAKTLYTPKINLLVDKNLKISKVYEKLPTKYLRSYVLDSSYIKDEKVIDFSNKSIGGFFVFLAKKLYE